ncbi:MAG: phytanoyl-CoA dioxygenase family protein [Burkholderiaceae bacterium]|nr:phytanoyl-CoA dioxygenase family protein [Burkholderiaceae bacterium]
MLSTAQIQEFQQQGFLVLPQLASTTYCNSVMQLALDALREHTAPIEYEADTGYAGAPSSRDAEGGLTARRLLRAVGRDDLLMNWARQPLLVENLRQLLGEQVVLSQAHHNCIMTKQPRFSSVTGWHRDSRYWQFARAELVSVWLALRDETPENGCLSVLPGSHRWAIQPEQLDAAQFLRPDLAENQALLAQAKTVALRQGDVLFFHSNLFHAAGRNQTAETKYSFVLTYRDGDNLPVAGSRSASVPEVVL